MDRRFDQRGCGTIGKGLVDVIMPVCRFAFQRHEQIARADIARVHLDARDLELAASRTTNCFGNLAGAP